MAEPMKPILIICAPAGILEMAGLVEVACAFCGEKVDVAPSGQRYMTTNPDVQASCPGCAAGLVAEHGLKRAEPVPGAREEVRDWLLWRQRN